MRSLAFLGRSGCFLPLLIILNLFFGWLIFKPLVWLAVGSVLVLLFLLNSVIVTRKILSGSPGGSHIIDVEGQVLEEKKRFKTG